MPRFSAAQREQLKAALMEKDDDIEDDDVLKPSLLHPSIRNIAFVSPLTREVIKEKKVEETERIFTEKKSRSKDAMDSVLSIKCFPQIAKSTDLKWLRTGQKIWPVFVNHDPSNGTLVNVKQGNKQIIEFIGNRMLDKLTIQAVSARSLSDYHDGDETSWNPDHMASYTKQLKRYRPFLEKKGQEQQLMILEEQFFLELLLKKQLQLDHEPPETNQEEDDDDDENNEETFNYEETFTVTQLTPPSTPGLRRCLADEELSAQCRKLRAGDVIEYIHPVFQSQSKAMILKVMPPPPSRREANDIVLSLSDGVALQRETEVRLVKRYLRGTLVDNPGSVMTFLWDFKLDASLNNKFKESDFEIMNGEKSMAEKMQDAYDEANNRVEEEIMKFAKLESADDEKDENQPCDRKRTLSDTGASIDANQRSPSRRRV